MCTGIDGYIAPQIDLESFSNNSCQKQVSPCAAIASAAILAIQQDQVQWQGRIRDLPASSATGFAQHINALIGDVLSTLAAMSLLGYAPKRMHAAATTLRVQLQQSMENAFRDTAHYRGLQIGVRNELAAADAELAASSLRFNRLSSMPLARQQSAGHSLMLMNSLLSDKPLYTSHHDWSIKSGRTRDLIYASIDEGCYAQSALPYHDKFIVATVHLFTLDLLAQCHPHLLQTYLSSGAQYADKHVKDSKLTITKDSDVIQWWNRQLSFNEATLCSSVIDSKRIALKIAKFSIDLLAKVANAVVSVTSKIINVMHVTDQNLAKIACNSLDFVDEDSPLSSAAKALQGPTEAEETTMPTIAEKNTQSAEILKDIFKIF